MALHLRSFAKAVCMNSYSSGHRYLKPQKILYNKFSGLAPSLRPPLRDRPWTLCVRNIRSRRQRSLTPVDELGGQPSFRDLIRPFCFTVAVSGASFGVAAVWQYESLRKLVGDYKMGINNNNSHAEKFFGKAGSFRNHVNAMWNGLSPGKKLVVGIIGVNIGVFCLWRMPAMQPLMLRYFSASPSSGAPCLSMLLSMFSHYSALHLAANMYVLWSFTDPVVALLGKEQFLAVYLSAGLVSGFTSYVLKVARSRAVPSLGASGAIMALLGMVCSQYPNAQLSIAFIGDIFPHSFSASAAMKSIIAFDTLGVLLRWRFFDHAAHLGGILFGLWYINYGHKYIWGSREPFLKWWHSLRGRP